MQDFPASIRGENFFHAGLRSSGACVDGMHPGPGGVDGHNTKASGGKRTYPAK